MTARTCPTDRCDVPLADDDGVVCRACVADITKALAELPGVWQELNRTIQRMNGTTYGGSSGAEKALPYDHRASDVLGEMRAVLVAWIRDLDEDPAHHPHDNVPAMTRWLLMRIRLLAQHPAADDIHRELTGLVKQGRRVVDNPAQRAYLGPCECGQDIYALPKATEARCGTCGVTVVTEERRAELDAVLQTVLVTGPEFAGLAITYLGVQASYEQMTGRIRAWAFNGLQAVTEVRDQRGRMVPAYRYAELRARLDAGEERRTG